MHNMPSAEPQPAVSIVLLAHNEAAVIETVIRDFYDKIVRKIPGSELIIAEDGSTDGTKDILARLCRELPALRWEEGKERRGYVQAFKQAMTYPRNDQILFCDCSGKHDPDDFWTMAPLLADHDLVVGYKVRRADPFYRLILSHVFNFLVNRYFQVEFNDANCPMRIFKKEKFLKLAARPWLEPALVNFEMTLRFCYAGYRVTQVPIKHFPRRDGPSRGLPLSRIPRVIWNVLTLFPRLKKDMRAGSGN